MWWQDVWRILTENPIIAIASIVNAVAIVVLVIITRRYACHTKELVEETRLARRDDPELQVYLKEQSLENLELREITKPSGTFLVFAALLINPGAIPIVIDNITEEFKEEKTKEKASTKFQFALPREIRPEQLSIYAFDLPWVISSDGFAVWSRYMNLNINKNIEQDSKYVVTIRLNYSVAGKSKPAITKSVSLSPKERPFIP